MIPEPFPWRKAKNSEATFCVKRTWAAFSLKSDFATEDTEVAVP